MLNHDFPGLLFHFYYPAGKITGVLWSFTVLTTFATSWSSKAPTMHEAIPAAGSHFHLNIDNFLNPSDIRFTFMVQ